MGKKRKRELREALDIRDERDHAARKAAIIIGIGVLICVVYFVMCTFNIFINFTNLMFTFIPTVAIVAALFLGGGDVNKASKANDQFKRYCDAHSITKQDLKDFEAMVS